MRFNGFGEDITPESLRNVDEAYLNQLSVTNPGGTGDTWARAELQRRQNERLADLLNHLENATVRVEKEVFNLTQSSTALQGLTGTLVGETTNVHREVALLTSSSNKLEKLTKTLKNLTWALIVLTILAIVVPIGIEVWKAYHELQSEPIGKVDSPSILLSRKGRKHP